MELEDVGLEGDLAAPREEMHVVAAQGRAAVAQHLRGEKDAQSAAWGRASRRVRRAARSLETLAQEAGAVRCVALPGWQVQQAGAPCSRRCSMAILTMAYTYYGSRAHHVAEDGDEGGEGVHSVVRTLGQHVEGDEPGEGEG